MQHLSKKSNQRILEIYKERERERNPFAAPKHVAFGNAACSNSSMPGARLPLFDKTPVLEGYAEGYVACCKSNP
jgi:hypothetical protein